MTTASASAKDSASSRWKTLRRVVLLRGSKTAQRRCVGVAPAQRAQGFADGGGMMAKIVHHRDAAGHAAHFHAPPHAFEGVEGGLDLFVGQSAMLGGGDDGQGVAHVELAHQIEMEFEAGDFKLGGGGAVAQIEGVDAVFLAQAEAFDRAMRHVEQRAPGSGRRRWPEAGRCAGSGRSAGGRRSGWRRGSRKCRRDRIPGC